ncbi:MAG TPA: SDR family oxidoreductase [Chloroflexota bacterium]
MSAESAPAAGPAALGQPLLGQRALVLGGSGGIGGGLAEGLAAAGADVAVTYHTGAERAQAVLARVQAHGRHGTAVPVNVREPAEIEAGVRAATAELGPLDVLVTAIGAGAHAFFMQQATDEWERVWETDLRSIFYACRAVLPAMQERKAGRLIFLSSDSAKVGNLGGAVSSAARGGIHSFVKSLAREMARDNITVNAVCPGPTRTEQFEERMLHAGGHMQYWDRVVRNIPLKRIAEPREIASLVVYLASPDAGFITGQAISVSGGLTMS